MPTYPREDIAAGILAGGRATRMGGSDKGLIEVAGRPMVAYVLDALRAQSSRQLINANRSIDVYERYGVPVVRDRLDGFLGPLAGMAAMMHVAERDWLLTAPCDSPQVPVDLGPRLWAAAAREHAEIAVAHSAGRLQPVFALLRTHLVRDLEAYLASGERKIRLWYQQHALVTVDFSDCAELFINVNTPEERDALSARIAEGKA